MKLSIRNKRHKFDGNEKGFSLLELLIGISIFAVGILATTAMQWWSVRNNTTGNVFTQANMLAQAQLETLKNQDFSALVTGNYNDPNNPVDENGNAGGIYNRSWTIANYSAFSRQVTVTVQWSRIGGPRSVVLTSLARGNGI
ncbi:MAG: prepilin-type N-terminal cleavage/methylation domain-containing protein [Desulfobacterales bacterium]